MTVVLLTGDGLEHRYVSRALAEAVPDLEVFVERPSGSGSGTSKRLKRWMKRGPGCVVDKVLRELFRRGIGDSKRRQADLRAVFGNEHDLDHPPSGATFVPSINDPMVSKSVRRIQPELGLVYGTGLVRKQTLKAFSCPILNLHTGLSPYYRGVACHFWPLIDGRPDRIGVTVHDCVPELDAGGILATGITEVQAGDTIHRIFARQVVRGAGLYAQIATESLKGQPRRQLQNLDEGREYRGVELGFMAEWRARRAARRLFAG